MADDIDLGVLTWPEARRLAEPAAIALWPVGSIEAHGPHLPLATDMLISRDVTLRAAWQLEAKGYKPLLLPELPFGVTRYAAEFPGTMGLRESTLIAIIADVAADAARHGLRRLCLVNNHLEPAQLETLAVAAAQVSASGPLKAIAPDACERRWARTLSEEFKRGACHAGRYETSLVLRAQPSLARSQVAAGLTPVPIDLAKAMRAGAQTFGQAGAPEAYFGAPAEATREEGEELLGLLTTMVVTEVLEKLPL
jgi:creatinine amidohydrolase